MTFDQIDPFDFTNMGLGSGRDALSFPVNLLCPQGHRAVRSVVEVIREKPDGTRTVKQLPFWVCAWCEVVYRYQECRLAPGDEGIP